MPASRIGWRIPRRVVSGVERVEARGGWTGWEGGMVDVENMAV